MISFIIYFHSTRLDNLSQTLRFLEFNELNLNKEIILICQDKCNETFKNTKLIQLGLNTYHKAKMCNIGVENASNDKIVILDSDRILPFGYFEKISRLIEDRTIISCDRHYKLSVPYTDAQISDNKDLIMYADFKSRNNELMKKNLFAGNTAMLKKDYVAMGGMDESYIGHGFCDNDMTENAKNHNIIWMDDIELHLYHDLEYSWNGEIKRLRDIKIVSAINALRFCKKWKKPQTQDFKKLIQEVMQDFQSCDPTLREEFTKLLPRL